MTDKPLEATALPAAEEEIPADAGDVTKPPPDNEVLPFGPSLARALEAQFIGPFRPRTTARRCARVRLSAAWISHLLTLLIGIVPTFFVFVFAVWVQVQQAFSDPQDYSDLVKEASGELSNALCEPGFWLAVIGFFAYTEIVYLAAALVLMPWAAGDQRVSIIWRQCLRSIWLLTALAFWCFNGMLLVHTLVTIHVAHQGSSNWFLYQQVLIVWIAAAASIAGLVILLRFAGTSLEGPTPAHPPMCECCGYNLSHTPVAGRCPECGRLAAESIGPGRRKPTCWEQRANMSAVEAYARCATEAVFHPSRFFRAMPTRTGQGAARAMLIVNLALAALLTLPAFVLIDLMDRDYLPTPRQFWGELAPIPLPVFGALLSTVGLLGAITGLWLSRVHRRSLILPVAKVFFYSSGLYVLWAPGFVFSLWALVSFSTSLPGGFLPQLTAQGMRAEDQGVWAALLLNLGVLIPWFLVHRRGIKQILYANT